MQKQKHMPLWLKVIRLVIVEAGAFSFAIFILALLGGSSLLGWKGLIDANSLLGAAIFPMTGAFDFALIILAMDWALDEKRSIHQSSLKSGVSLGAS